MTTREQDRLDAVEERVDNLIDRFAAVVGLVIGLVLTAVALSDETAGTWAWMGSLSAVALVWIWLFSVRQPVPARIPWLGAVYVVGLIVLMAALTWFSPFFAFMTIGAYGHAACYLHGNWRFPAIAAAAACAAFSQMGGRLALPWSAGWLGGMIALLIGNSLIAGGFVWFSTMSAQQTVRRKKMIADLERANAELEAALAENVQLHAQLVVRAREAGVQDERTRMAREIHDTIAQGLTGIVTQLEAADAAADDADVRDRMRIARGLARESLTEARRSVDALRPEPLEDAQLPEALGDLVDRWSETTGIQVRRETTGATRPLLPDVEVALFRVAQEALANVAKHSDATTVGITLSYMDDVVVLDVRDDGRGFDLPDRAGGGFGLTAMEQRVHRVSGRLTVESAPGEGTALSASVPAIPAEMPS
ncbi:histidine kinase [Pseudonocardia sulfidoxydans NBRC 16205]|uniref:Oxygen sensor histidine kinase NreB n=1 Tax=Pseudonocardia sulfidoxydans NBRC 16205 TaxID=1223511 RepID=A0A511DGP4_9PSEU|nr:sensor histidine kinase [Pseudonocardia sulfidoxydans]GEL23960.1 histidine kinase [Pseudonocardia sulfidoxydans NBRC 16205]